MAIFLKLFSVKFREPAKPPPSARAHEHVRLTNPWHAVSLVPCANACAAARQIAGKRFLSSESPPKVPLPECPLGACTCRYRHHDDRRASRRGNLPPTGAPGPRRRAEDHDPH